MKLDFSVAKILTTFYWTFAHFKDKLEGTWSRLSWWVISLFHSDGRNSCFTEDALLTWNQFFKQASSQVEGTDKTGDKAVFLATLDPFGDEAEEESNNDFSRARKVYHNSEWKPHQDAVYWIHLAKAQEKGLHFFWLARSHAMILYDSVPTDCIEKEVHQGGDNTLNQRLSTPRPAPKTVLKDVWELKQQQQQQQQNTLLSTGKLLAE